MIFFYVVSLLFVVVVALKDIFLMTKNGFKNKARQEHIMIFVLLGIVELLLMYCIISTANFNIDNIPTTKHIMIMLLGGVNILFGIHIFKEKERESAK